MLKFLLFTLSTLLSTFVIADHCSSEVKAKFGDCLQTFTEIRENANQALERKKDSKVYKGCLEFSKCSESLKCGGDKEVATTIDKMSSFCEVVTYRETTEFAECDSKLDPNKSRCVKEWQPFPQKVDDPVKMAEIQKEACKNFFRKDNCMEKEIRKLCGTDMWEKFRKYFLALKKLNTDCGKE